MWRNFPTPPALRQGSFSHPTVTPISPQALSSEYLPSPLSHNIAPSPFESHLNFNTIGEVHVYIRDKVFNQISPIMCKFAEHHPELCSLPITPKNLARLAQAESDFVRKHVPETVGDYLAYHTPPLVRLAAVGTIARAASTARGPMTAVRPGPFQEEAREAYWHAHSNHFA